MSNAARSALTRQKELGETDVLVAGGGIAGCALAFELASRGAACTLLTGQEPWQGASQLPAAVINPHRGRAARSTPLDSAGAAATLALGARLNERGLDSGVRSGGVLRVAGSARQSESWRKRAAETVGLEAFATGDFGSELHAPFGGLRVLDGGSIEPPRLLAALREAATSCGAAVHDGVSLIGHDRIGGRLHCETTAGVVSARRLVLCLGAYDAERTRLPRLRLERGGALKLRLRGELPRGVTALAGPVCVVALSHGEVVITGGHVGPDDQIDFSGLLEAAAWSLPQLRQAELVAEWSSVRAKRESGVPVAKRIGDGVYMLAALGGRGFLTGPLLAARLAQRLAAG